MTSLKNICMGSQSQDIRQAPTRAPPMDYARYAKAFTRRSFVGVSIRKSECRLYIRSICVWRKRAGVGSARSREASYLRTHALHTPDKGPCTHSHTQTCALQSHFFQRRSLSNSTSVRLGLCRPVSDLVLGALHHKSSLVRARAR